jgi:tripeptidyl-peptidase I
MPKHVISLLTALLLLPGFSNIFEAPSYQSAAVKGYLEKYAPKYGDSVFNSSGRGFPDVSALGLSLATVYENRAIAVGGTSASAPIFASIVTLLNEERLAQGKKPIGFLNPTLYKHPEMFNDITVSLRSRDLFGCEGPERAPQRSRTQG